MDFRMPFVPVGVLLEGAGGLNDGEIVAGATNKLNADGEIFFRESTRNGKRGQAAEISDAAEGIGERQASLEIHFERRSRDRLRRGYEQIYGLKEVVHFLLQLFADPLREQII